MTEYEVKEYTSNWLSTHRINTDFRRWVFPFYIISKNKENKRIELITRSPWFSNRINTIWDENK